MNILKHYCKHEKIRNMCPDCNKTSAVPSNDLVSPELEDGYPTEKTIEIIRNWPHQADYKKLMAFVKPIFEHYGRVEYRDIDGVYEVATGGWSGCEDAIAALKANWMFWACCWILSKRGGYYEFERKG